MPERLTPQNEPTPFIPEDWDGHTQDDDCLRKEGEGKPNLDEYIRDYRQVSQIAEPVLTRFLASPDRTVLRRFKRGDVFRIDRFSHEAVVRFTTESYVLGKLVDRDNPYHSVDFWGVVCALPERVILMRYFVEFSSGIGVLPGFPRRTDKIIPEVTVHQRYREGFGSAPDALIRDRDLALYSAGKTAPELEKERQRLKLPNFGSIFRRPVPKPAK